MSDPQGYVTDAGYADTFFRELSPAWLNYVSALNGTAPRDLAGTFRYLELGCGTGTSAIVNAGAFSTGEFHACDLNPAHIDAGARQAARLGIDNIHFHEASFDRLLSLDLPAFDFIVLHGVYSWVGAEARHTIRRVIRKTLRPGGLVYLSYNALPGWSTEAPLRKLLLELAATADGASPERAERAVRAVGQLSLSKLRYFKANPAAVAAIEAYAKRPSNYLAHEFLNQTWEPFYSVDVADEMAEAELEYLGSATLVDNHAALVADAVAAEAVAKLDTDRQRRLAMDFAVNQRFRRDVFIRGRPQPVGTGPSSMVHAISIGSPASPERISATVRVPRGEITFQTDFITDLRALMRRGSMTLSEAVTSLGGRGRNESEIGRNLIFLVAAGSLMPFARNHQPDQSLKATRPASALVERVIAQVIERGVPWAIPCEVLGNGVQIGPIEALGLTEVLAGADTVESLTRRLEGGIARLGIVFPADHIKAAATDVLMNLAPSLLRLGLVC